jgi:hypothetical protein
MFQEAPLREWANFRQRALDTAILEITKKTDLKISIKSLERSKHRRVTSVTLSCRQPVASAYAAHKSIPRPTHDAAYWSDFESFAIQGNTPPRPPNGLRSSLTCSRFAWRGDLSSVIFLGWPDPNDLLRENILKQ